MGQLHTVCDVPDNVLGALQRAELGMILGFIRGNKRLVFYEAERIVHLSDVVVQGTDLYQRLFCSYRTSYRLSEGRNLQGVLESSGSLFLKLAKKIV